MSSSYSSLDRVLSHWAHSTVNLCLSLCILYFVYYRERVGVDLMGLKPTH